MVFDPASDVDRLLAQQVGWGPFDDNLLYTCWVLRAVMDDNLAALHPRPTRMRIDPGERSLAEDRASWSLWSAVGDGSWEHNNVAAFGSAGFVVAAHLGNAMLNRSRRARAQRDARPRWVPRSAGVGMVSQWRVCFQSPDISFSLYWREMDAVDLITPDCMEFRFPDSEGDNSAVRVHSPWAVLMFVLAAASCFPGHPLLLSGNWLPRGFEERCHIAGKTCPQVRAR
ncbi:hypothetical protein [Nocardia caishijiensis]|uniref:Uncharacterized protein n=1 Tax=Nocardia caishijiensis TaxID=184756 RepID=A0ABQ6YNC5_9NOCA|nr:hypothetical protein [Nocardia caishijiensis]KAF0847303.1 hypothetical protein FNL39_103201 [Nocardia caishijiensis]